MVGPPFLNFSLTEIEKLVHRNSDISSTHDFWPFVNGDNVMGLGEQLANLLLGTL